MHVYDISDVPLVSGAKRADFSGSTRIDYDLVVCSQVLEHVPDPLSLVEKMRSVLRPHTLMYLEVPYESLMRQNEGSRDLAARKHHWHEHINFFSLESMRALIHRAQLNVVEEQIFSIDAASRTADIAAFLVRLP
ncbi:class I SAM-dependent methyltransferase [Castellaniella caeni]